MTSVHPLFVVDVNDEFQEKFSVTKRRPTSSGSGTSNIANTEATSSVDENDSDDEDLRFQDEIYASRDSLQKSIASLVNAARVFGLYFSEDYARNTRSRNTHSSTCFQSSEVDDGKQPSLSTKDRIKKAIKKHGYPSKIYSIVIFLLLWGNVLRFLSVFVRGEQFDLPLINKLTTMAWMLLAAIMQTSCVVACWSGRADRVLREIRVTEEFAADVRRRSIITSAICVFFFLVNVAVVAVAPFYNSAQFSSMYAPFTTYVDIDGPGFVAVKIAYLLVAVYIVAAWMFPQGTNHMLALIVFLQFRMLNERFIKAIDENGRFNGSLRTFRRRHQALCRIVKKADHFVMIANVAGFICHMFTVIMYLYTLIKFSSSDVFTSVVFFTSLIVNIGGLVLCTTNGIMINEMAHKIGERLHNIDLSQLSARENSELNMFQRRLTGQPIGFSVLGIFVINRKTVLSLLGLLITYFLLVLKMTSKKASSTDGTCSLNTTSSAD